MGETEMASQGNRLIEIDRAAMTPLQERVQQKVDTWGGRGATPFKIWMHCPEAAAGMEILATHLRKQGSLADAERELVTLMMTVFWDVSYATAHHVRHGRAAGLSDEVLDKIVAKEPVTFAEPRLQAVYDMATGALAGGAVSDADFARFEQELGRRGIAEVLILIGFYTATGLGLRMHGI